MVTAGPLPYLCCQLAWAPCPQCPAHYQEDFLEEVLMLVPSPVSYFAEIERLRSVRVLKGCGG